MGGNGSVRFLPAPALTGIVAFGQYCSGATLGTRAGAGGHFKAGMETSGKAPAMGGAISAEPKVADDLRRFKAVPVAASRWIEVKRPWLLPWGCEELLVHDLPLDDWKLRLYEQMPMALS